MTGIQQKTTDIEGVGKLLVQSVEADFEGNKDRFLFVMQALGNAHGEETIRPYMERYKLLKKQYEGK